MKKIVDFRVGSFRPDDRGELRTGLCPKIVVRRKAAAAPLKSLKGTGKG